MKKIGTYRFYGHKFIDWYKSLTWEDVESLKDKIDVSDLEWTKDEKVKQEVRSLTQDDFRTLQKAYGDWYRAGWWSSCVMRNVSDSVKKDSWDKTSKENIKKLETMINYQEILNQDFNIGAMFNGCVYVYLGSPDKGVLVPDAELYGEATKSSKYDEISPSQLKLQLGVSASGGDIVPTGEIDSLTNETLANKMSSLEAELEDVQNCKSGKLAEMKAEIDRMKQSLEEKKNALMAEIQEKKNILKKEKEKLEKQIFILDSQLYNILCYAGETIKIGQLKKGAPAADEEPIVVYQKLRILDEELGRMCSLYDVDWDDAGLFEQFLANSPAAQEVFCPNEKCVVLVRISRDNKSFGHGSDPFCNMMAEYEVYHGNTVGIIIRNGENIWIGWTDEERVVIEDDLILNKNIVEVVPGEKKNISEWEQQREEENMKKVQKKMAIGLVSRQFVYSFLQGVVDRTDILNLPAGVTLSKQSEYVKYAIADNWLVDNRFGDFGDVVAEANSNPRKGDMILSVQHLSAKERLCWDGGRVYGDRTWENPRGRGDKNRTHDCFIQDKTIYPINLIEKDEVEYLYHFNVKQIDRFDGKARECYHVFNARDYDRLNNENEYEKSIVDGKEVYTTKKGTSPLLCDAVTFILEKIEEKQDIHVYVSVKKACEWRDSPTGARANMEIYSNEYWNLTNMNSVVLGAFIANKDLGSWRVQGEKVNYAYAIRYLNKALEYIKKREKEEKQLIDAVNPHICEDPDWPLILSDWKKKTGVRKITSYQASRFCSSFGRPAEQ